MAIVALSLPLCWCTVLIHRDLSSNQFYGLLPTCVYDIKSLNAL